MVARDTTPAAAALQLEILRNFSPEERLRQAIEMSEFARRLMRAGLRAEQPELTEEQLDDEMLRRLYGFVRERK